MKRSALKGLKAKFSSTAAVVLLVAGFASTTSADNVPPWVDPDTPPYTMFWGYDFDDGIIPPTLTTTNGGSWQNPAAPTFTISGIGDVATISGGMLGIHNATGQSSANIRLLVDNDFDAENTKYFWFEYDFAGPQGSIIPTAGTDQPGHVVSPITYTANTIGNHVEGYITILPQPEDEWLNLNLIADIGETVAIDNLLVGSTCIPEPTSVIMLAFGGLLLTKGRKLLRR